MKTFEMLQLVKDYTIGSFLEYNYFKKQYKVIRVDLSKQKSLDAGMKLEAEDTIMFFIIEKQEKLLQIFQKEQCEYCNFILL